MIARLVAIALGLGGVAGTWWAWWAVSKHVPLAFRWWVELYIEPFVILGAACFISIVIWESLRAYRRV